jgi:hypothetical protein
MFRADGRENFVYDKDGFRIARRIPFFSTQIPDAGILVDLKKVHNLFTTRSRFDDDNDDDDDQRERRHVKVYGYPQAYLHDVGHVQANGVPDALQTAIDEMNNITGRRIQEYNDSSDNEGDDDDDGDDNEDSYDDSDEPRKRRQRSPVSGISCQMYNHVMHRIRPRANQHDAQLGALTNTLAGTYARGSKGRRTAQRFRDACLKQLPHDHFQQRLQDDIKTGLRLEAVYKIVVPMMKVELQTGKYVLGVYY